MSDDDRYWSVRLIVYAFESEDEAREYQNRLLDAFCALPESAGLGSVVSHFEGSSFDEIARLRAEVERLTAALADERRHADALAEAAEILDTHAVAIHDADGKCYSVSARDYARLFDALDKHRTRHQMEARA